MLGSLGVGALSTGLAAIGGLGESALAYKGQKDTNQTNRLIAKENREFQAEEAATARDFSAEQAAKQRSYADQQAKKSRAFQERMSSTSFQRSMQDLEKAGLNPIMAAGPGAGASTPVGATAQGQAASASGSPSGSMPVMQNPGAQFKGTTASIVSSVSGIQDARQKQQDIESYDRRLRERIMNNRTYRSLNTQQQTLVAQQYEKVKAEVKKVAAETEATNLENVGREILADFYESAEFAKVAEQASKSGITAGVLAGILGSVFGMKGKRRGRTTGTNRRNRTQYRGRIQRD